MVFFVSGMIKIRFKIFFRSFAMPGYKLGTLLRELDSMFYGIVKFLESRLNPTFATKHTLKNSWD